MCWMCLVIYQICGKVMGWHTLGFMNALFVVLFFSLPEVYSGQINGLQKVVMMQCTAWKSIHEGG